MDQGGFGLHAGAFKKFVHFFRNSFFPLTKCGMVNLPLKAEAAHMWRKTSAYMLQVYEYTNLRNKIENVTCRSMPLPLWHSNSFWSITCLYLPRRPIPLALHQSVLLQTLEVFQPVFSAACRPIWWESVTSYPYVWESSVTLSISKRHFLPLIFMSCAGFFGLRFGL